MNPDREAERQCLARTPPLVLSPGNPSGNARILVDEKFRRGDRLETLCFHRGVYRRWDGSAWVAVGDQSVRVAIWNYFEYAIYQVVDKRGNVELHEFKPTKVKVAGIEAALRAVVYVDETVELPSWFGVSNPAIRDWLPMANGILHVPTRKLIRPTPDFFNSYSLRFDYVEHPTEPQRWRSFLAEIFDGDDEQIATLQEVFGYLVAGDTLQQKIFLLLGPKRSGKGTTAGVLRGLVGPRNVAGPTLASLSTNFGLQPLIDRPLGIISDARLGTRVDGSRVAERLLTISGEDAITADRKYLDPWTGILPTRFLIISNEVPGFSDSSGALASRFVVLETNRSFYGHEDPGLKNRLLEELHGIFAWALEGYDRLTERGCFVQPAGSAHVVEDLDTLASPVGGFVQECCDVGPGHTVSVDDLFEAWRKWCNRNGRKPGNRQTFGRDLRAAFPEIKIAQRREHIGRQRFYEGIRLRPSATDRHAVSREMHHDEEKMKEREKR